MKVPRHLLNREVRITWIDPFSSERVSREKLRAGRGALAVWRERGVIDDITEGVVRFIQSEATMPGDSTPDEFIMGYIPEELITKIEVGEFKDLE